MCATKPPAWGPEQCSLLYFSPRGLVSCSGSQSTARGWAPGLTQSSGSFSWVFSPQRPQCFLSPKCPDLCQCQMILEQKITFSWKARTLVALAARVLSENCIYFLKPRVSKRKTTEQSPEASSHNLSPWEARQELLQTPGPSGIQASEPVSQSKQGKEMKPVEVSEEGQQASLSALEMEIIMIRKKALFPGVSGSAQFAFVNFGLVFPFWDWTSDPWEYDLMPSVSPCPYTK